MKIFRRIAAAAICTLAFSLPLHAQWTTPDDTKPPDGGPWQNPAEASPPNLPGEPELVPIGGLLLLLAAGVGYGVYRLRKHTSPAPEKT